VDVSGGGYVHDPQHVPVPDILDLGVRVHRFTAPRRIDVKVVIVVLVVVTSDLLLQ
jgi:hypothetical protein